MLHYVKYLFVVTGFFFWQSSAALNSELIEKQADASIGTLYHSINSMQNISMHQRLYWFSKQFIGRPYLLGALGEGATALYDQYPRYRIDAFDCDTYVNTVLALALSNSSTAFRQCINNLRYQLGITSYINRKHFTSIDWNYGNQKNGILQDITTSIHNKKNLSVVLYATALIDKPRWYSYKSTSTIRLNKPDKALQQQRLTMLKEKGKSLEIIRSRVPYIPLTALFPKKNKPDLYLFSQIPDGAIIEIIRPEWDLREQIGTYLDISHLGFAFWHDNTLYFSQASSQYKQVVEVPLIDYLREALSSPTIKGINIQIVLPKSTKNTCTQQVSKR